MCLAVMQHRMMKEAQKAMTPWMNGQPLYAPMSNHSSSYQMNPMLYAGQSNTGIPLESGTGFQLKQVQQGELMRN